MDELSVLSEQIVKELIDKEISLSAAESMTGGLFAKCITDVPGASKIFDRSLVTYSNRAKFEELNVILKEITLYGAVSKEVANLMATGLNSKCGSKICISVTGVAGPGPDDRGVPEGTFYIGLYANNRCRVRKFELGSSGRDEIRRRACIEMFKMIDMVIKNELTTL